MYGVYCFYEMCMETADFFDTIEEATKCFNEQKDLALSDMENRAPEDRSEFGVYIRNEHKQTTILSYIYSV